MPGIPGFPGQSKPAVAPKKVAPSAAKPKIIARGGFFARSGFAGNGGGGNLPVAARFSGSGGGDFPVNDGGFVRSPDPAVNALLRGLKPAPNRDPGFSRATGFNHRDAPPAAKPVAKPHVKVTVHPSGKIEVTHAPASSSPTSTAPAGIPSALPKGNGAYQTDSQGRTDTTFNPRHPGANGGGAIDRVPAHKPAPLPLSIEQQAQAILDPVKQSILDAINQRLTAQQGAITSYSKDLAQMMGQYGPAAQAAYGTAQTGQAAVDAALAQTLSGQGNAGQAALAGKLAQIDADPGTVARLNATAAGATQGAASAAAGRGAASLSDLISRGASAADYGAKLPGVAGLYGLQATKSAQSQGTTDTANAVSQLEQELPSIVNQIRTNQQQQAANETTRALAATQALGKAPAWAARILGVPPGSSTATARAAAASAATAAQNAATAATNAATAQTRAQTAAENARVNAAYKRATLGITEQKLRQSIAKEAATAKAKGQHLGLSAKDWQKYNALALSGARSAHNGTPDGTHPPISWQQYLTIGTGQGIPIGILVMQGKKVYSHTEIKQGLIPGQK